MNHPLFFDRVWLYRMNARTTRIARSYFGPKTTVRCTRDFDETTLRIIVQSEPGVGGVVKAFTMPKMGAYAFRMLHHEAREWMRPPWKKKDAQ